MNDESDLLHQLKIAREPEHEARSRWAVAIGLGLILIVVLGIAAAWWVYDDGGIPVQIAVARSTGADPAQASVLDASGYVVARRQATVSSKVTGKVVTLNIEEGQRVAEGDVLARIDPVNAQAQVELARAQLSAARAVLAELQVQLDEARRQLRRARELAARQLLSQADLDSAQARADGLQAQLASARSSVTVADKGLAVQQQALDDTVVRAPFAGVITVKNAQVGEMISPLSAGGAGTRTGIGTLVDMDSLEVEVDVSENFINRVEPGQAAAARLNAYPDWSIPAEVIAVIPAADRSKATVKVRIALKAEDPRILPDMGVRVAFLPEAQPAAAGKPPAGVIVPAAAVHDGVVYILRGDTAERRAVKVGEPMSGGVLVTAGLRQGERVVIGDFARIADGAKLEVMDESGS